MGYRTPYSCKLCDWLCGLKDGNYETYWCGHPDKNSCQMDLAERGECDLVETTLIIPIKKEKIENTSAV